MFGCPPMCVCSLDRSILQGIVSNRKSSFILFFFFYFKSGKKKRKKFICGLQIDNNKLCFVPVELAFTWQSPWNLNRPTVGLEPVYNIYFISCSLINTFICFLCGIFYSLNENKEFAIEIIFWSINWYKRRKNHQYI